MGGRGSVGPIVSCANSFSFFSSFITKLLLGAGHSARFWGHRAGDPQSPQQPLKNLLAQGREDFKLIKLIQKDKASTEGWIKSGRGEHGMEKPMAFGEIKESLIKGGEVWNL